MGFLTDLLKEIPLSAVLKERLAGADAKYGDLQSKYEVLHTENEVLHTENEDLHTENATLRVNIHKKDAEIADLKKLVETLRNPPSSPSPRIATRRREFTREAQDGI